MADGGLHRPIRNCAAVAGWNRCLPVYGQAIGGFHDALSAMRKFILACVFAAAGLAVGYYIAHGSKPGVPTPTVGTLTAAAQISAPRTPRSKRANEQFTWAQVESGEPLQYMENLRRIGCPEETICDIVRAHVSAAYQARVNLVFNPLARYWNTSAQAGAVDEEVKRLRDERDGVLARFGLENCSADLANPVPPEKQSHIAAALKLFPKITLRAESTTEERVRAQANRLSRINYLAQFLTADELLDYRIVYDGDPGSARIVLAGLNPTDQEFRRVFNVLDGVPAVFTNGFLASDIEGKLKEALGAERYAAYRKDMDADNPSLRFWGQSARLTETQIEQLIALRATSGSMSQEEYRQRAGEIIQDRTKLDYFLRSPRIFPQPRK